MTVKMPEPFGWLLDCLPNGGIAFQREKPSEMQCLANSTVAVITTDQAEAYANERVREALEEAARICDEKSEKSGEASMLEDDHEEQIILQSEAWKFLVLAHEIRALISQEKS